MASKVEIDIIANDKTSGVINGITGTFGKLSTALGAIAVAGAAAFVALGKQALDATAEYERMTLTMETLVARELKNADATLSMADALGQATPRAQELLGWIQKLAIESPFDMEGVAVAYRTALAYGFTSTEAQKLTQNMIDFAAGTGQSVNVMNQAALALGQIRAKGKLAGQEILQLVNAGVPVNDILKEMGYTLDDVSKGLVSADEFLAAFSQTMDEDFSGAAKRSTNSWAGLMNSLGDIKKIGLRTLFAETFDVLQPLVAKFAEWLQGDGLTKIEAMGHSMGTFAESIKTALVDLGLLQTAFSDERGWDHPVINFGDWLVNGTETFKEWANSIDWEQVSGQISDGIDSVDWSRIGTQVRDGLMNITDGLSTLITFDFTEIANSLAEGFADAVLGVFGADTTWDQVMQVWTDNGNQFNQIRAVFQGQYQGFVDDFNVFRARIQTAFANLKLSDFLLNSGSSIRGVISGWIPLIANELDMIKKLFFNKFQEAAQQPVKALAGMVGYVVRAVQSFMEAVKAAIKPINIGINVSIPNFAALAEKIAAGMEMLSAAAGGGFKGGKSTAPNVTPPKTGAGNGTVKGYAGGGVASGPKSGYTATLHGTEAVIPLENGDVPIKLANGGGGGMVVNLTYAPAFSTASKEELLSVITPMLNNWYRQRLQS